MTKDTNARVAGRRKQTKESLTEWLYGLFWYSNGSHDQWLAMSLTICQYDKSRCYCLQVLKFLYNLSLLLTGYFAHLIGWSANIFSFVLCFFLVFWSGLQSFPWSMFTYNLIDFKQSLLPPKICCEVPVCKTSNFPSLTVSVMWDRLQLKPGLWLLNNFRTARSNGCTLQDQNSRKSSKFHEPWKSPCRRQTLQQNLACTACHF